MTDVISNFRMGDKVPDWLLAITPGGPDARLGAGLRFACDVLVVDAPDCYIVIPQRFEPVAALLDAADSHNCRVWAADKMVRLIHSEVSARPIGSAPPRADVPPYAILVQPHELRRVAVEAPDPHATLWARLRYALTGR